MPASCSSRHDLVSGRSNPLRRNSVLHLQRAAQVDGGVVGHGVEHDAGRAPPGSGARRPRRVGRRPATSPISRSASPQVDGETGGAELDRHQVGRGLGVHAVQGAAACRDRRAPPRAGGRPPPGRGPPSAGPAAGVLPQAPAAQSGRRWPSGRTGSSGAPSSSDDGAAAPQADASAPRRSSCPERGAAETSSPRTWHHTSAGSARCPPCSTRCTAARSQQRPSRRPGSTASNGRSTDGADHQVHRGAASASSRASSAGASASGTREPVPSARTSATDPPPSASAHLLAGAQPLDHQVVRVAQASQRSRHAIAAGYASRRLVRLARP